MAASNLMGSLIPAVTLHPLAWWSVGTLSSSLSPSYTTPRSGPEPSLQ